MMAMKYKARSLSLTLRVILFVATAFTISLILISTLVLSSIEHHFLKQDASEINVITQSIISTIKQSLEDSNGLSESLSHAISGHHGVYYQVERNGKLLFSTVGIDFRQVTSDFPMLENISEQNLMSWVSQEKGYRGAVVATTISSQDYRITSAIDMSFHQYFLSKFKQSLALIMLGAAVFTLLAVWLGIHQGLKPLRGLSERMGIVKTNKLDLRLDPLAAPIELENLVISFNHMLARLEQGFVRLSDFSADIAHELRTPLTNITTQTQVGLSKARNAEEYSELLYSNLEELERLSKMISDMLWLAKSENGLLRLNLDKINIVNEIKTLFDFFDALAEERHITLSHKGAAANICADQELLRRALSNLLSNAIRHASEGTEIVISVLDKGNDSVDISITNTGTHIPEQDLERIFERFYRVDSARQRHSDGAGLGLSIVRSIIEAHGGFIHASSIGEQIIMKITLPIDARANQNR
jgi:two-component system heavy metal sensor histidine kinase CusS